MPTAISLVRKAIDKSLRERENDEYTKFIINDPMQELKAFLEADRHHTRQDGPAMYEFEQKYFNALLSEIKLRELQSTLEQSDLLSKAKDVGLVPPPSGPVRMELDLEDSEAVTPPVTPREEQYKQKLREAFQEESDIQPNTNIGAPRR